MRKIFDNWSRVVARILHLPTTIVLIGIAVLFSIMILKGFYDILIGVINGLEFLDVLERVFLILLFVEVIASIKIYFAEHYHFPLRFFLYIGITHMVRHIIISHDSASDILLLSFALLVLVSTLAIYEVKSQYLRKKYRENEEEHFEL
ncbi:MAG: hypothetical protein ACD_51C00224G0024 [uncultured bacterium]|nr:MAG: hypothetical protein ACD_51C00224G0024 [uncultured bacterium]OGJ48628.1 MAG: hypothetical protein A2344_05000 [Candidatus Peregrinibacteria bacterium RIFOXYB12_FULL_41_12]OGJ48719.1 MAG: hypothetical protein A2244_03425 [Candidatus Peregrinibacteria bacterium RIFOXYA2_FULL_41_18]OGJ53395.1 MAG: hypothetical protein A2448_03340 [Candidatus Peregrinibacteria bacterium RIFOXYC2_FULL_41_22]OGJ54200.1 MAG: hypothetical protein A2336_00785 [Candidatus Peregrinibacteria bacterium RIFOXYB2_FULL